MSKRKSHSPNRVNLSHEETEQLKKRLFANALNEKDLKIVVDVLNCYLWMQDQLSRAKLTLKGLKALFGFKSEKNDKGATEDSGEDKEDDSKSDQKDPGHEADQATTGATNKLSSSASHKKLKPKWNAKKNHGRYSVDDYQGCPVVKVALKNPTLLSGYCPDCMQDDTKAKVYPQLPSTVIIFQSDPMISGIRYQLDRTRCCVCLKYFTADLPEAVREQPKYAASCKATLAIHHYYCGMPFNRIEMVQSAQQVPLAVSTQYDLMSSFHEDSVKDVFYALHAYGANGEANFFDDTPGRILEQIAHNKVLPAFKKSVHATAMMIEHENHQIALFNTNTLTGGKQLAELLSERSVLEDFKTMSDAASKNFPTLDDTMMARWIICLCLCHGRRNFFKLLGSGDEDVQFVLEQIAIVYHNESYCKKHNLTGQARLEHHQKYSAPVLKALRVWFNNLFFYKKVEPNSEFGRAITYMLKRWYWLTQFLRVLDAPLDNNICEQAIKVLLRYRKNSLFYKTFYGAEIGDAMMSVIHTAVKNNVNVFDYLTALAEYSTYVRASPEKWFPWCYQETLQHVKVSIASTRQQAS